MTDRHGCFKRDVFSSLCKTWLEATGRKPLLSHSKLCHMVPGAVCTSAGQSLECDSVPAACMSYGVICQPRTQHSLVYDSNKHN